jgi:hypothetical protein
MMNPASNQDAMERFGRARDLHFKENKQASEAVVNNNISNMENIFKTGGVE